MELATVTSSLGESETADTLCPFTYVPLVDSKITNRDALTRAPHLGVLARDVRVVHHHFNIGTAPNNQGEITQREGPAITGDQPGLTLAADELRLHLYGARLQNVVDEDLDPHGPDKGVPFGQRVLAYRLFEFGDQRLLEAFESCASAGPSHTRITFAEIGPRAESRRVRSTSRTMRVPISIGCNALLKGRENVRSKIRSRRFSTLFRTMTPLTVPVSPL